MTMSFVVSDTIAALLVLNNAIIATGYDARGTGPSQRGALSPLRGFAFNRGTLFPSVSTLGYALPPALRGLRSFPRRVRPRRGLRIRALCLRALVVKIPSASRRNRVQQSQVRTL